MEKELRIKLNTVSDLKGIESVKRSFSEMERESMRAVSAQRSVSSATSDAAKSVDNLSERIGFMGHAYVGFQAVMAGSSYMSDLARDAIAQADTWNLLEGRLRLVTDSTQQLVSVQADLFDIAQESRTSFESNADLYARIARATQDMNKSQYETLDVTEAISKSFIVSGAAAESAKAAVIQLGQGFASGVLRGEELNSVLEQAPRLAEAIADGMGVSVGQLKKLGEEGKLTAEKVYEAILTQKKAIEEEFDQMPKTVGQSLVNLQNQIGLTIHEFDQMHGVTTGIAEAISGVTVVLSDHSGEIGDYVGYVGTAVTTILAWKIGTIALSGAQKLHDAYLAASTVTTTAYSMAVGKSAGAVTTLTARQVAANVAMSGWNKIVALNPYAIAGAAIVGVGIVLKNQADELRDSVRRTAVDVENLSAKALQAKITYGTIELDKVNESINNPSIMQSLFGNERIALHRRVQIENELKTYGKQLQKLHEVANAKPSGGGANKPYIPTDKELKAAAKSAEEYAKNYKSLQDTIFNISASDHDKAIKSIEDQAKAWRDQKMPEIEIARYVSEAKSALNRKELDELGSMMKESRKITEEAFATADAEDTQKILQRWESGKSAMLDYYKSVGDETSAFYIEESDKIARLAEAGLLSNEELIGVLEADQETFRKSLEKTKDATIKLNTVFEDAFKSMEDSMVDMFMTGKFKAEDFFNSIIEGIIRMQIRNSITQPLTTAIGSIDFSGMFSGMFASANGNAFNRGAPVYAFANGGAFTNQVVSSPTMAPMSLFGEAGPEAIMPLTRIGSSLGVKATPSNVVVNIQNNSGTPVSEDNVSTSFDGGTMIVNVVLDAITRNKGGMRDTIRGVR
ncbi:MAG: tape measure protein [Campylobacterota bacterium]